MTAWLPHPPTNGRTALLCFHFAGGGASTFAGWRHGGMPDIDICPVQLPGREGRGGEARLRSYAVFLDRLTTELLPHLLGHRLICYGHSLGAWAAWDVALMLSRHGTAPLGLIAGAQRAPSRAYPFPDNAGMDDAAMLGFLRGHGMLREPGLDEAIVTRHVLPLVRDDLALCEGRPACGQRASFPIMAVAGCHDTLVDETEVRAWQDHAADTFSFASIAAGHLFVRTHADELRRLIADAVEPWTRS